MVVAYTFVVGVSHCGHGDHGVVVVWCGYRAVDGGVVVVFMKKMMMMNDD